MALDPGSGAMPGSPESSGRDSPIPRQWRNQLGGEEAPIKDKAYRRYAAGVEKTLALFETALEEWADYISFLNRLLKSLQARPSSFHSIPSKALVAKRLSQCLNPTLPSGVHQKALEVYTYIFTTIGKDGLSRDLPLYLPGLAPTLSFASLSVRSPFLDLLEEHFLEIDPRSLRPAMKSVILALLPGLEEETSEDFDRTLGMLVRFKKAIRPRDSQPLGESHSTGDAFFWQCFFLASITSQSRRSGALAYLVRFLPALGVPAASSKDEPSTKLHAMVTSPEPGLLVRCFASGLGDEQILIQRGFLDLLVSHLPLNSEVLQQRVKPADLELLIEAAVGVVTRRDMSLNRRLWAWLLGPEPPGGDAEHAGGDVASPGNEQNNAYFSSRTSYFEEFGLQSLTRALLDMIGRSTHGTSAERARPYRVCLSLMDRWEIGGLVVPEVFMPVIDSVRSFQKQASSKSDFIEVLRSASVFFDGIESGLIYSELVGLLAQAIGPGNLNADERMDRLSLANFIISNFNVREEEMVTIHAPITSLAALFMLEDTESRRAKTTLTDEETIQLGENVLGVALSLLDLVPARTFPEKEANVARSDAKSAELLRLPGVELLRKVKTFYVHDQGNLDASSPPFTALQSGELLLHKAIQYICDESNKTTSAVDIGSRVRILSSVLSKTPATYTFETAQLLSHLHKSLAEEKLMTFLHYSSMVQLSTQLRSAGRIDQSQLSDLVPPLVGHAWSYLSASEPKYHVETVRCLWQLQSALSLDSRDVEAALSTILISHPGEISPENVRTFGVLWSHTLQDTASDRRGSKTQNPDTRSPPRLTGMDHYHVMLTQPAYLVLDALLDDRTQSNMAAKTWINSTIGLDRLFLIFIQQLAKLPLLGPLTSVRSTDKVTTETPSFTDDDDVDLCLYCLRTMSNVLRCSGDMSRSILASKFVSFDAGSTHIRSGAEADELTLQEYFIRVCMWCITADIPASASSDFSHRAAQLHRYALTVLHQFFMSKYANPLGRLELEGILIDKLSSAIGTADSYVQVLLLDVVLDTLKMREAGVEAQPPAAANGRPMSAEASKPGRLSVSADDSRPIARPMPPALLKCLQAGLSSTSSQVVLDGWIAFLGECISLYSQGIFQVLIPLVETLCRRVGTSFTALRNTFLASPNADIGPSSTPESTLIHLLNGLEQVLALGHDQLLAEESHAMAVKSPDQPQSLFGSMVSGVFQSEGPQSRSATANDRLTVHLAFQDAMRICYRIWSWGQGDDAKKQDSGSAASLTYTSLRMRNRARRLMEHLFTAETLECLETVIDIWRAAGSDATASDGALVFSFLSSLDACRPRHSMPALFNAIYSRTNPHALDPSRQSTMTIALQDVDLVVFLVEYSRSLDDDAMDEIWQDCMTFLKDLLGNPFPHRQTLPSLLEFAGILGEKVDNTNFGEQRRMRRELGDLFNRLLAALFTTRPLTFTDSSPSSRESEKSPRRNGTVAVTGGPDDVVAVLASVVPNLPKILLDGDRVLSAAGSISTNVIGPTLRSKSFPDTVSANTIRLLKELSKLENNQKTWRRDVGEAFNDGRFFGMRMDLVRDGWLPLLKQWALTDKEKLPEIVGRISAPTTAGIVFGVGATSARLEADRKTQLNLRRIATLVLASADDAFAADLATIFDKLFELLAATSTSSPSSTTRADVYMVMRALVLRTSPVHLAMSWPMVNAELHAAISSVVAPDHSAASDTYLNSGVLQACKLLDLLICVAPDDFQLHEWLFVTDTIEAVYRSVTYQPVALADELSEDLGHSVSDLHAHHDGGSAEESAEVTTGTDHGRRRHRRRPLLGAGISDEVSLERKDELVAKVLRPFFGQLSIFAFESTYAMGALDKEACVKGLLRDLFDERTMVRAL